MRYVYLGKETISSKNDVYEQFKKQFELPEYFGNNLDGLHDCLTDGSDERLVILADREYMEGILGRFFDMLLRVLEDSSRENENITIREIG